MLDQLIEQFDAQLVATRLAEFAPRLLAGVLVFVALWIAYSLARRPIKRMLAGSGLVEALVDLLVDNILKYSVLLLALVMGLDQLGFDVTAALAGLGVAGIAIGFAAQDTVANVIAGFLIFVDKPFGVGDWVEVSGQSGEVSEITLRTTRIKTPNNTWVVIPNKMIIDEVLVNHTRRGHTRVDVSVGIAYKESIVQARQVLLAAVTGLPHVLTEPGPDVVAVNLGDSSVDLQVRVWIEEASSTAGVTAAVVEASKIALDDSGIEIPFPHLQLFLDDVKMPVWEGLTGLTRQSRSSS